MIKKKLIAPIIALTLVSNIGCAFAGNFRDSDRDSHGREDEIKISSTEYSKFKPKFYSSFIGMRKPLTHEEIEQRNDEENF
ncbi:MAG: hypothetical protein MJA82_05710 [Clostridia bacterium]|nr:hypothetical protein [Clostridia bacterium]